MSSIPIWLTGRNISSVTAKYEIPNAAGALPPTAGSTIQTVQQVLTGFVDEIDINNETTTQSVVALTSTLENYVPVEDDPSLVLTEIMRSASGFQSSGPPYNGGNYLASLWYNGAGADHVQLLVTRGGNSWVGDFVMVDYSETIRKAKSTAQLTVRQIDVGNGVQNPSYASP